MRTKSIQTLRTCYKQGNVGGGCDTLLCAVGWVCVCVVCDIRVWEREKGVGDGTSPARQASRLATSERKRGRFRHAVARRAVAGVEPLAHANQTRSAEEREES
jgi:hypothetical protein